VADAVSVLNAVISIFASCPKKKSQIRWTIRCARDASCTIDIDNILTTR